MSEHICDFPRVSLPEGACPYCRISALEKVAEELMIAKTNDPESFEYMDGDDRVLNALEAAGYLKEARDE